jgi:adenylate cyclase
MFTDMVGYSALTQSSESQALEVLQRHNKLLRPFFSRFNGKEIKTIGDSFLVEFDSALDALRCGLEIQSFLHDYNFTSRDDWKICLRIGIHLGDVIHENGDVFGDAVNIASRIEPNAEAEGICISEQMYDQIRNKVPQTLVKIEQRELKNIAIPIDMYKVLMPWEKSESKTEPAFPITRIAVLPFANLSPDPNDEYFADGITEEIISTVSGISGLSVISRTSIVGYKGATKKVREIGKELEVGTILEGSFRKAGNRIRVTTQLINVTTDEHLWAQNYDRELNDIFAVQSDIAMKVANALRVRIKPKEEIRITDRPTMSTQAHALYLKGRFHLNRYEKTSLFTAISYFEKALAEDPNYALAYCGLSDAYTWLAFLDIVEPRESYVKAERYARKALEMNESLAEAHASLAWPLASKYDFKGAIDELDRAIEINPNLVAAYGYLASIYASLGNWDKALKAIEKELRLDPFSVQTWENAGTWYLYSGRYDEAIKYLKDVLELDPNNSFSLANLGLAHIQKGLVEEGLKEVERASELSGRVNADLAYAYVKAGEPDKARALLKELLTPRENRHLSATAVAGIYSALGEKDKALDWLERAYEEHSGYLVAMNVEFIFENIRNEPRFQTILRKMNLV